MAARVPAFGNWDKNGDVPYTKYFDNARVQRSAGRTFNPNDPQENPEAFSSDDIPPIDNSPYRTGTGSETTKSKDERRSKIGDGISQKPIDSPARNGHGAAARKPFDSPSGSPPNRTPHRVNPSDIQKKGSKMNTSYDRSFEQLPLHPHSHVKPSGKGGASPSLEKRSPPDVHAPNAVGRARMRPRARGNETPDSSSTLPVFGEWNDNNPQAGEGYTDIFYKLEQEKQGAAGRVPAISVETSYHYGHKKDTSDSVDCVCFRLFRK